MFSPRFCVLIVCSVLLLATIACSLGGTEGAVTPETKEGAVTPEAPQPTVMVNPTLPSPTFTLTLPDGRAVVLSAARCEGTSPGAYLTVRAVNTEDVTDPDRIEVQVAGNQQGAGRYDGFYV